MKAKSFYKSGFLVFCAIVLFSCEEEVSISTREDLPEKVVVEGRVTNEYKEHLFRLTSTSNYFDTNNINSSNISDAYIIEEGTSKIFSLQKVDTGVGYYKTEPFAGKIGENYNLQLIYKDENYSASAYLNSVAEMDSISYLYVNNIIYGGRVYLIKMSATEPQPAGHIYTFNFYINDTLYNDELRLTSYQEDEFFNGLKLVDLDIAAIPQEEIKLDSNIIRVEMLSISRDEFNFNNAFLTETLGNGSIFSGPPADVPSNIKNNSSDNNGLGFFAASAIDVQEMILIKQHDDSTNDPDYKK